MCLWLPVACVCERVCTYIYTKPRQKKFRVMNGAHLQCSNCAGGLGVEPPPSPCRSPYLWSIFDPGGGRVSTPHLSFAEVGMLLDSHFLLMQFLKYLGLHHDDLNVTTS